jgi:hypothetical protein
MTKRADHLMERSEEWVKEGKLVARDESIVFSPNYPKEIKNNH